jgi:hypothetical protein
MKFFCVVALLLVAGSLAAQGSFSTDRCPVSDEVVGYPLWVEQGEGGLDSVDAHALLMKVIDAWLVPSRRRDRHTGWENVRHRIRHAEPRWADDWKPAHRHTATLQIVIGGNGAASEARLESGSGDRLFDGSLTALLEGPLQNAGAFPPALSGRRATVRLGTEPAPDAVAVVRFAAQQRPVRLIPGSFHSGLADDARRRYAGARATIKYDVSEEGFVPAGSIEVLHSTHDDVTRAITSGLLRARFQSAESNCRRIAQSVLQLFDMRPAR